MRPGVPTVLFFFLLLGSCSTIRESPKYEFKDGTYRSGITGNGVQKVYVEYEEEEIKVYRLKKAGSGYLPDTLDHKPLSFSKTTPDSIRTKPSFTQRSFDIDFLTMPFKYRFPEAGFPRQFNASLNGGVYVGYRSDVFMLQYSANSLGVSSRHTTHLGFSFGGFTGIGGTPMNPWVTNDRIAIEYDGVVLTKGIAGIIGLNNLTAGLAVGWDHLLDRNKKFWIYQGKPWIGFVFGLNLN
jgi:hypothetical protein